MKLRNSNIELLRIISIIMIILSHYTVHNGVINSSLPLGINRFLLEIATLGNIGVVIFVLITGYFSINNTHPFKMKKMVLLILETLFYSVVIYFVFVLIGREKITVGNVLKNFLPITFKNYWFMTSYLLLYIFIPFINRLLNNLNKKEHTFLIIIGFFIFIVLGTITTKDFYGNSLVLFLFFYIIGAYFGKYKNEKLNKKNNILLIISITMLIVLIVIMDLIGLKYKVIGAHSTYFFGSNSIFVLLISIFVFNYFINKKEKSNLAINNISKYVLGVYLISDNYLIRQVLWTDLLNVKSYVNSNVLFLHIIISITIIFIVCIFIDFIRANTIERLFARIYNKLNNSIKNKKIYKWIKNKIKQFVMEV